jgi:hypothetical protein
MQNFLLINGMQGPLKMEQLPPPPPPPSQVSMWQLGGKIEQQTRCPKTHGLQIWGETPPSMTTGVRALRSEPADRAGSLMGNPFLRSERIAAVT